MPTQRSQKLQSLGHDLKDVFEKGLLRCFNDPDDPNLPYLRAEVQRIYSREWATNPTNAASLVIRAAINLLDATEGPSAARPILTWRALGKLVFLQELPEPPPGNKLSPRTEAKTLRRLADNYFVASKATRNRRIDEMIGKLADQIVQLPVHSAAVPSFAHLHRSQLLSGDFIPRPKLEALGLEVLHGDQRRLVISGDSGNGKSILARRLALLLADEDRVFLLSGPDAPAGSFDHDLSVMLEVAGHEVRSWNFRSKILALQNLMTDTRTADVIILDGVSRSFVTALPSNSRVMLIAVPSGVERRADDLIVGPYTPDEAEQSLRAANISSKDRAAVALTLGMRPLTLNIAALLIREGQITVPDLLAACRSDITSALDRIERAGDLPFDRATTQIFRTALSTMADDSEALAALDAVLWLMFTDEQDLIQLLAASSSTLEQAAIHAAITRLESNYGLISTQPRIEVNDLALRVLRSLRRQNGQIALAKFVAICQTELDLPPIATKMLQRRKENLALLRTSSSRHEQFAAPPNDQLSIPHTDTDAMIRLDGILADLQAALREDRLRIAKFEADLFTEEMILDLYGGIGRQVSLTGQISAKRLSKFTSAEIGILDLRPLINATIVWQAGVSLFAPSSDTRQYFLLDRSAPGAPSLWCPPDVTVKDDADIMGLIEDLGGLTWPFGGPQGNLIWDLERSTEDETLKRHLPLLVRSVSEAQHDGLAVWSCCGRLYDPSWYEFDVQCEDCVAAAEDASYLRAGTWTLEMYLNLLRRLDTSELVDAGIVDRVYETLCSEPLLNCLTPEHACRTVAAAIEHFRKTSRNRRLADRLPSMLLATGWAMIAALHASRGAVEHMRSAAREYGTSKKFLVGGNADVLTNELLRQLRTEYGLDT